MLTQEYFLSTVEKDFFHLMCGEYIGRGASRQVYELAFDTNFVVKIESEARSFANVIEWETWQDTMWIDHARPWLAPCHSISPSGAVLIQRRTKPAKKYPEKIAAWFTDIKRSNFGMIGKRFVCHDYGCNLICNSGMTKRLVNAKWPMWEQGN